MDYVKARLKEVSTWKGAVLLVAYVAMYFTPDSIDKVIQQIVGMLGVLDIVTPEK